MPESETTPAADTAPRPGDSYVQSFARGLAVIRSFDARAPQQTLTAGDLARVPVRALGFAGERLAAPGGVD